MVGTIRDLATKLFECPDEFLRLGVLDNFVNSRDALMEQLDAFPLDTVQRTEQCRALAEEMKDWPDFFSRLAGHDLFSVGVITDEGGLRLSDFHTLWNKISGFDVDGLLEIGDPRPLARQKFLPKHDLGNYFLEADAQREQSERIFPPELRNNHVHFGQDLDFNILWLGLLRSWRGEFHDTGLGGFEENKFNGYNTNDLNFISRSHFKYFSWCRFFVRCWIHDGGKQALEDFLKGGELRHSNEARRRWIEKNVPLGFREFDADFLFPANGQRSSPPTIGEVEAEMLHSVSAPVQNQAGWKTSCSLAYVITKNAAFHQMLSNTVRSFDTFTRALKRLDDIYKRADIAELRSQHSVTSAFTKNYSHSQSHAESPITLLRKPNVDAVYPELLRRLAIHQRMGWELTPDGYTLGFHREDFDENVPEMMALPDKIVTFLRMADRPLKINAIDLCGPEIGRTGKANYEMLIGAVETVFQTRKAVEDAFDQKLRASFHVGEQPRDDRTALLSIIFTVLHPEFRPETDRLSHALALSWLDKLDMKEAEVPRAQGDLLAQCIRFSQVKRPEDSVQLFDAQMLAEIGGALQTYLTNDDPEQLRAAAILVLRKVEEAEIFLEICPFSNELVREEVTVGAHPWKSLNQKLRGPDLLIGTDDPSLTQTLPWMERAFFALSPTS